MVRTQSGQGSGKLTLLSMAIVLIASALWIQLGSAASITVSINDDIVALDGECSLREAVIAANTNTASGGIPGECPAGASGLDFIYD